MTLSRYGCPFLKNVGLRWTKSLLLSLSLTTVTGPAPTGLTLSLSSPIFLNAVGDAIQLMLLTGKLAIRDGLGWVKCSTTVSGSGVVIGFFFRSWSRGAHVHDDFKSRLTFH